MSNSKSRRAKGAATAIPETTAMGIPFNQLRLSEKNVRTIYDKETVKELAESIATHGLIQSLGVRPVTDDNNASSVGMYEIHAGGRRFRAIELLLKQKRIAADKPIPCVVKTDGFAEDDSYVENTQRESMHPIDEFRAFKTMLDSGRNETDIASTHRVSIAFVRQRLRLASASPLLLQAFRDEDIDLEQLMAYCITDDQSRQESVFERMKDSYDQTARTIRRALMENTVQAADPRVRFVTLQAYEKAGGIVERDLFSSSDDGYLTDVELLNTLVADKLNALAKKHQAKGWKWAQAAVSIPQSEKWNLDRVFGEEAELTPKEQKRLDKLNAEIEQLDKLDELTDEQDARRDELQAQISALEEKPPVFSDNDMARAGVFISLNQFGEPVIDAGFIKPDDAEQPSEQDVDDNEEGHTNGHANGSTDDASDDDAQRPLSASLIEDLTSYKTIAARNALAQDFNVAFTAVVHTFALSRFYTFSNSKSCLQLKIDTSFPSKAPGLDDWAPTKAIADRDLAWRKLLPKNSADLWSALLLMEHTTLQGLFAHLASLSVNATITPHVRNAESVAHVNDLFRALETDMVKAGWTNTVDNYLGRVSKDRILEAVTEARGDETTTLIAHLKKDPMGKEAQRLLENTGWLPEVLRVTDTASVIENEDDRDDAGEQDEPLPTFLNAGDSATEAAV